MESPVDNREMYLVGDESGGVFIQCRRKGCLVDGFWPEIPVPMDARPWDVDQLWVQHSLAHANKPR